MEHLLTIIEQISPSIGILGATLAVLLLAYRKLLFLGIAGASFNRLLVRLFSLSLVLAMVGLTGFLVGKIVKEPIKNIQLRDKHVDLSFREVPLAEVLRACAAQSGVALALDSDLKGNISIKASGAMADVLNQICEVEDCTWQVYEGNPPILFVKSKRGSAR